MSFTPETLLRHWQTLRLIPRHPRKITAAELCQHLGGEGFSVGKRTVERDLQSLSRIFPLIVDERSKPFGWSWDKEAPAFDLPGISSSESLTLLMAREYLRSVMPSSVQNQLAPYFRQAEQKLDALAEHSSLASWLDKVRIIPPTQPLLVPVIDESVEATLQEALLLDRQCLISYQRKDADKPDEYPINPLGLVQRGALLYLICTIKTYADPRILVLHRVRSAELLSSPVQRPREFDLDTYLSGGAFGWGAGNAIQLEVLFNPESGNHLYETPLSVDQVISIEPDGRLRVVAAVPENKQLLWWLLGFGEGVEVLAPKGLRESVARCLTLAARRYHPL